MQVRTLSGWSHAFVLQGRKRNPSLERQPVLEQPRVQ